MSASGRPCSELGPDLDAKPSELVAAPHPLRFQIGAIMLAGRGLQRHPLDYAHPRRLQPLYLAGIVGEQPDVLLAEPAEHGGGNGEVALVVAEAEAQVRIDRVEALVLERIGAQLVDEADAA